VRAERDLPSFGEIASAVVTPPFRYDWWHCDRTPSAFALSTPFDLFHLFVDVVAYVVARYSTHAVHDPLDDGPVVLAAVGEPIPVPGPAPNQQNDNIAHTCPTLPYEKA